MITPPGTWPLVAWAWLVGAAAFLGLIFWSRHSPAQGAPSFRGLAFATVVYVATSALEIVTADDCLWYFVSGCMYVGVGLISPYLLLLFADTTGQNRWFTPLRRRWLVGSCAALGALRFADPWLGAVFRDVELVPSHGMMLRSFTPGPVFALLQATMVLAFLAGGVLVWRTWREAGKLMRYHFALLLFACQFPFLFNLVYIFGYSPFGLLDPTPFGALLTLGATTLAIFDGGFMRMAPIARSCLLEHLAEGVLVTDPAHTIVDLNPAAARFLGLDWQRSFGQPIGAVLARWPALAEICRGNTDTATEIRLADSDRHFRAYWHPLSQAPGAVRIGFMLVISDITLRKRAESQLREMLDARTRDWKQATAAALSASEEEQTRLGYVLHDTLCQDLIGFRRTADELVTSAAPGTAAQLIAHATQLGETAKRARDLAHLLAGPDLVNLSFEESLQATIDQLERSLDLACDLTVDPTFPKLDVKSAGHLIRIVREAVSNAARHARARQIWIDLLTAGDGTATVTIANDGIPPPPEHARTEGLGWRQMRMRAALLNGTISIRSGPDSGAIVELVLPPTHK